MASHRSKKSFDLNALRDQAVPQELDTARAKEIVQKLNDEEASRVPASSERRTYGRTPKGTGKLIHSLAFKNEAVAVICTP